MGSRCELQLYIPDGEDAGVIAKSIIAEIARLEQKYTRYQADSVTSAINRNAGSGRRYEVDRETRELLDYAALMYRQSDGLFDITSGSLRSVWNFKSEKIPCAEDIAAVLPRIGWQKVEWQPPFIYLPIAGMELDFGGYVKEYAADCAAARCVELGVSQGLINLGGDIHILGPHPDGRPWQVGIQHPRMAELPIATVAIQAGAITTSGDYERYMIVDGIRYCHLLDPTTGRSIQPHYASVSVVAEQCLVAGTLSTLAMLHSQNNKYWIKDMDVPFLMVTPELAIVGTLDV